MNRSLLTIVISCTIAQSCQKSASEENTAPFLKAGATKLSLSVETGSKDSLLVESNTQWKATITPATADWLSINITEANGNSKIIVTARKSNTADSLQKATIVISPVSATDVQPISIPVSQSFPIRNAFGGYLWDQFTAAVATTDGGILAVGTTESNDGDVSGQKGNEDCWIIKIDANGKKVWQKTIGGTAREWDAKIIQTADGNFLISANGESNDGDFTALTGYTKLFKIDGTGNILTKKSYNIYVRGMINATGGGYLLAGMWNNDYAVIKLDADLNVTWDKHYGGSEYDLASSIIPASDNGYIVVGGSRSADGDATLNKGYHDFWIVKIDDNGKKVWEKSYGGSYDDYCESIAKAQDGGYIVAGHTGSKDKDVVGHHGNTGASNDELDAWTIKIDANGNKLWAKTIGGTMEDMIYSIIPANGGGFLAAGYTRSNDGDVSGLKGAKDAMVLKLAENGDIIWSKTIGGTRDELCYQILEPTKGNYAMIGVAFSQNGDVIRGYNNAEADGFLYRFK